MNNDSQLLYVGGFNYQSRQNQRTLFLFSDIDVGWRQILIDVHQFAALATWYSDIFVQMSNNAFRAEWPNLLKVYIETLK